jgi:hypothetical protein
VNLVHLVVSLIHGWYHAENGGFLHGVCSPFGFSLLFRYYGTYRRKTAVKGEFPFRPRRAKKEFLI